MFLSCCWNISCILLKCCCLETYWVWLLGYHFNWLMKLRQDCGGFGEVASKLLVFPNTSSQCYPSVIFSDNSSWELLWRENAGTEEPSEIKEIPLLWQHHIFLQTVQNSKSTTFIRCRGKTASMIKPITSNKNSKYRIPKKRQENTSW